jgi:hypothetical protein
MKFFQSNASAALVGGWGGVAVYILGITAFFVILAQLLAWISRRRNDNKTLY